MDKEGPVTESLGAAAGRMEGATTCGRSRAGTQKPLRNRLEIKEGAGGAARGWK